jgi:hypothetical protein
LVSLEYRCERPRRRQFRRPLQCETFIISSGAVPAPDVFPAPPAVVPEATAGLQTNPVQMCHLGLWFDSAADAATAGCPATATPFNGEHNAGIQVLNTASYPDLQGPFAQHPITNNDPVSLAPKPHPSHSHSTAKSTAVNPLAAFGPTERHLQTQADKSTLPRENHGRS